jgi:hypothetical protein
MNMALFYKEVCKMFQKDLYNFESLDKSMQRTCTVLELLYCNNTHRVLSGIITVSLWLLLVMQGVSKVLYNGIPNITVCDVRYENIYT